MQSIVFLVPVAVAAGISVFIQQVLNANLRTEIDSAIWSGFISYFLGVICMLCLVVAMREPIPSTTLVSRVPWWAWSGGLFGAIFIGLSIFLVPKLGGATFIALLVAGQMMAALTFDHFGWLGLPERPVDIPRLLGVALLVGGVLLIRR